MSFRYLPGGLPITIASGLASLYALFYVVTVGIKYKWLVSPKGILILGIVIGGNFFVWSLIATLWHNHRRFTFTPTHLIAIHRIRGERVEVPWESIVRVRKLPRAWWARGGGGLGISVIETVDGQAIPVMTHWMLRYKKFLEELQARAINCQSFDPYWSEWDRYSEQAAPDTSRLDQQRHPTTRYTTSAPDVLVGLRTGFDYPTSPSSLVFIIGGLLLMDVTLVLVLHLTGQWTGWWAIVGESIVGLVMLLALVSPILTRPWGFTVDPTHLRAWRWWGYDHAELPWTEIVRVSKVPRSRLRTSSYIQVEAQDGRKMLIGTHLRNYHELLHLLHQRAVNCQVFDAYTSKTDKA